ncbi:MAG TPA: Spy/CpxP family protein refolding chaperone [Alphaproteobacteria bacterium]|nr:Spy/CpxP family protein refolding chaperone [Alphaproteobacteria bacterium]
MTAIGRLGRGVAILGFALLLSAATSSGATAAPPAQRGPAEHVEARIADLHKKLHITTDQEPQFKAFADVMRDNAHSMEELFHQRAQNRDRTATGQLHWYAQLTTAHADGLNKLLPAFDALYQSLSDKQKKAADAAFVPLRQGRPAHRHG